MIFYKRQWINLYRGHGGQGTRWSCEGEIGKIVNGLWAYDDTPSLLRLQYFSYRRHGMILYQGNGGSKW